MTAFLVMKNLDILISSQFLTELPENAYLPHRLLEPGIDYNRSLFNFDLWEAVKYILIIWVLT